MTVTNVWDDDALSDIWGILENGLEDVLEGSDSYDDAKIDSFWLLYYYLYFFDVFDSCGIFIF